MRHWILGALTALLLIPLAAFAHGEDKPGPHGGAIRMPGAYHTEVVADGARGYQVYLLDVAFKDPVVADSTVELTYVSPNGEAVAADCDPSGDHFVCRLPEAAPEPSSGTLKLRATRLGSQGSEVSYPLPLQPDVPVAPPAAEHRHHGHDHGNR